MEGQGGKNRREEPKKAFVVLLYTKGSLRGYKEPIKKHNIQLFCKARYTIRNTIRNVVVCPNDPLDPAEKCGVVYKCKCEACVQLYVGETERSLRERAQEHNKSVKEGDSKSGHSQHQVMTGHKVLSKPVIEGVSVIDREPRNMHRKVKEAIHIKLQGATGGYDLPDLYLPLLREETGGPGETDRPRLYHFQYSCTP